MSVTEQNTYSSIMVNSQTGKLHLSVDDEASGWLNISYAS